MKRFLVCWGSAQINGWKDADWWIRAGFSELYDAFCRSSEDCDMWSNYERFDDETAARAKYDEVKSNLRTYQFKGNGSLKYTCLDGVSLEAEEIDDNGEITPLDPIDTFFAKLEISDDQKKDWLVDYCQDVFLEKMSMIDRILPMRLFDRRNTEYLIPLYDKDGKIVTNESRWLELRVTDIVRSTCANLNTGDGYGVTFSDDVIEASIKEIIDRYGEDGE